VARQTPLGARPNRVPLARPALEPGRLLKTSSDGRRRGMTVLDRTRLIGRLRLPPPGARPNRDPLARPALDPGRLLERCGDVTPRGKIYYVLCSNK